MTYAGSPARGRAPRLAYVIETLGAVAKGDDAPTGICVVVDARTGKVLTTWRGHAARAPQRGAARSAASHAAGARQARVIPGVRRGPVIVLDDKLAPAPQTVGGRYGTWRAILPESSLANWDASPTVAGTHVFSPDLDAAIRNTRDVVVHMCFTRGFCSRDGTNADRWQPFQVTGNIDGNVGFYDPFLQRVFLTTLYGYQNDAIAHEFGHHVDQTFSGDDKVLDQEVREVREGIADMFAIDFDREDATFGEDGPGGKNTERPVENWATGGPSGQPLRMSQYDCSVTDVHFNSMILGHAYYSFAQKVTPDVAGRVLYQVVTDLGPEARFTTVANAFVNKATAIMQNPTVAADARQAFLVDGGMDKAPPTCTPAAPPPPPPPPSPPPPPPPSNVAVPDVRGDTPGAASSELSAVGLTSRHPATCHR